MVWEMGQYSGFINDCRRAKQGFDCSKGGGGNSIPRRESIQYATMQMVSPFNNEIIDSRGVL